MNANDWGIQWYEKRRERSRQLHEEGLRRQRFMAVQRGASLRSYPEWDRDADMCMAAVKRNGLELRYVPRQLAAPELCKAAVLQNGMALKHVPERFKTEDICADAVKQSPGAAAFVPDSLKEKLGLPAGAPKEEEDARPTP